MSRTPSSVWPERGDPDEAADDSGCPILHVDMDAFYASVEIRERPELAAGPVIVGAGERGVVLSATYPARRAGVHAAMPMSRARRLCPSAVVIPPHFDTYAEVSAGVMEIFRSFTPLVEPLSLDEAFLDVSGARRAFGPPAHIARTIRQRVAAEHRITCSVGVAPTKFVAKLASTSCKPDGMRVVPSDDVLAFLHPLPVGALWGVGSRTEEVLVRLGLSTVADLAAAPVATLRRALGPAAGTHLADLAWGRDPRPVVPGERERSIGAEETFARDIEDAGVAYRELLRLAGRTAQRLRAAGVQARTVAIKVRFADFTTVSRARTLPDPTDVAQEMYATARTLYDALVPGGARVRLVGVRAERLVPAVDSGRQLALGERDSGWREAERAADLASRRFGAGAVRPATLITSPGPVPGEDDPQRHDPPG